MTGDELNRAKHEIERLLSEVADQGPARASTDALQAILLDEPELQRHYARVAGLHTLLQYEFQHAAPNFSSLLEPPPLTGLPAAGGADSSPDATAQNQLAAHTESPPQARGLRIRWYYTAALAASLALVALGGLSFFGESMGVAQRDNQEATIAQSGAPPAKSQDNPVERPSDNHVMVRDQQSLLLLSRVTKTTLVSSLEYPAQSLAEPLQLTLCTGTVWMKEYSGTQERGYVVSLAPGCTLDLFVDADSRGLNSLAVVEVDEEGEATGESVSFGNRSNSGNEEAVSKLGCIGSWSKHNGTSEPKFYLFTGSHVLNEQSEDESWHLSDYRLFLNTPGLLYIGWDDSGYRVDEPEAPAHYRADRDFDDISATIHILPPTHQPESHAQRVAMSPQPLEGSLLIDEEEAATGYKVSLASGESMALRITAEAKLPNSIAIVEADSRRVLWRQDRIWDQTVVNPQKERSAYLIQNNSGDVQSYLLVGSHCSTREAKERKWLPTPYRVLHGDDDTLTVGFEDNASGHEDWNDIQVHVRWFSD